MTEQETTKKPRNSKVKQLEAELAEMKNSQAEMMDKFSAMMSMMQTFMGSTQTEKVEETPKPGSYKIDHGHVGYRKNK